MFSAKRLCMAVAEDRVDDVAIILSASPGLITCVDKDGDSLLFLARSPGMVHTLLQAGADANVRREMGWTPLHSAVYSGDPASAELLLQARADVDAMLDHGTTALDMAANDAQYACAELLLRYGANVDQPDSHGFTPLYTAILGSDLFGSDARMVELLLERGANPNVVTKVAGMTPLHQAAASGEVGIVATLLKYGADPSIRDDQGIVARELSRTENVRQVFDEFSQK